MTIRLTTTFSAVLWATLWASPLHASPVTPIAEVQRRAVVTVTVTVERITGKDQFRLTASGGCS